MNFLIKCFLFPLYLVISPAYYIFVIIYFLTDKIFIFFKINNLRIKIVISFVVFSIIFLIFLFIIKNFDKKYILPQAKLNLNIGQEFSVYEAYVDKVIDGDTLETCIDSVRSRVRLYGIDAPERNQNYYEPAFNRLKTLILYKKVTLQIKNEKDKYGRYIANVVINDVNINHVMVAEGFAWHEKRFAQNDRDLLIAETIAREFKSGLWKDHNPIPPWVYRETHKQNNKQP